MAIEIVNAGRPLSAEDAERLGTRFVNGSGRDGGGFGVGLSIAGQAVSLLDGKLTLRSADGATRARIELPSGSTRD